jgi:hypothetical protein
MEQKVHLSCQPANPKKRRGNQQLREFLLRQNTERLVALGDGA